MLNGKHSTDSLTDAIGLNIDIFHLSQPPFLVHFTIVNKKNASMQDVKQGVKHTIKRYVHQGFFLFLFLGVRVAQFLVLCKFVNCVNFVFSH